MADKNDAVAEHDLFGAIAPPDQTGSSTPYGAAVKNRWNVLLRLGGGPDGGPGAVLGKKLPPDVAQRALEEVLAHRFVVEGGTGDTVAAILRQACGAAAELCDFSALISDPGSEAQRLHYDTRYSSLASRDPRLSSSKSSSSHAKPSGPLSSASSAAASSVAAVCAASSCSRSSPASSGGNNKYNAGFFEQQSARTQTSPSEHEHQRSFRKESPGFGGGPQREFLFSGSSANLRCQDLHDEDEDQHTALSEKSPIPIAAGLSTAASPTGPVVPRERRKFKRLVTAFVALQDIPEKLGPTLIVPGTANREAHDAIINAEDAGDLTRILEKYQKKGVKCVLKTGDLVLMDSRSLHLGRANEGQERRILLDFAFVDPSLVPSTYCGCILQEVVDRRLRLDDYRDWTS